MYSRIRHHGDRQTTGDWQFEEVFRLGRTNFLKLPIAHALSVEGVTLAFSRGRKRVVYKTSGSRFDGYANSGRFGKLWQNRQTVPFETSGTQNVTRDHDSVPQGLEISSYGPFSSHLVRISSQIRPNPTHSTWGNLGMDFEEPGCGFLLFFQWRTLNFEGSKKAPETSFLDS